MLEIWAVARFDLGLADEEIGRLNLKEYAALIERKRMADNRARFHVGIVAAAILNSAFGPERPAVTPLDFVPDWKAEHDQLQGESDLGNLTPQQQAAYFADMFSKRIVRKR